MNREGLQGVRFSKMFDIGLKKLPLRMFSISPCNLSFRRYVCFWSLVA